MWFFYYSIPVLEDILRNDYFEHYLLLVTAITLLNQEYITTDMLEVATDFLHKFVREFEHLYGLRFCSINIHQLLHLPYKVYNLGPLWAYSCFQYENLNGQFVKLVHGTWHLDTQIVKKHEQIISLPQLIEELPEGEIRYFCMSKKRQVKILENIFPQTYSVGIYKELIEVPDLIFQAFKNEGYQQNGVFLQYSRLLKNNKLYISKSYPRTLQTESYLTKYCEADGNWSLGAIDSFIKFIPQCNCQGNCRCIATHSAIIYKIVTENIFIVRGDKYMNNTSSFLHKCRLTDEVKAIQIESLDSVCVNINIENRMYVGIPVNEQDLE